MAATLTTPVPLSLPGTLATSRLHPAERAMAGYLLWMLLLFAPFLRETWAAHWLECDLALLGVVAYCASSLWPGDAYSQRFARTMVALWGVLPLAYSQAGAFGTRWAPSVEWQLTRLDLRWFGIDWWARHPPAASVWNSVLESVYLSNYALVFFLLTLWASVSIWKRWTRWELLIQSTLASLLTSLLLSYALYPLLPAITPRLFFPALAQAAPLGTMRVVNHWFLVHGSIPWGIFPSGHVAGPVAMGGTFLFRRQRVLAAIYLASAVLTGIATVHGDYHFVCDAVGGALTGAVACGLVEWQLRRRHRRGLAACVEATPTVAAQMRVAA